MTHAISPTYLVHLLHFQRQADAGVSPILLSSFTPVLVHLAHLLQISARSFSLLALSVKRRIPRTNSPVWSEVAPIAVHLVQVISVRRGEYSMRKDLARRRSFSMKHRDDDRGDDRKKTEDPCSVAMFMLRPGGYHHISVVPRPFMGPPYVVRYKKLENLRCRRRPGSS